MNSSNERNVSMDLLRIISMLMIITLHYIKYGQALLIDQNVKYLIWYIEIFCMVAVNLYVLISGYYLIESNFSWKKVFKLCKQVWFYSILFLLIHLLISHEITLKQILLSFFPILLKVYWFITIYLFMYIMSPYLNKMIKNLTKREHLSLCLILIFIFSILHLFLPEFGSLNPQGGYSIIWFIVLYIIAGYIRKYVAIDKNIILLLIPFLNTLFILLIKFGLRIFLKDYYSLYPYIDRIYEYYSIFILVNSICLFLYFRNLKIDSKTIKKLILTFSTFTFGVYLIHENIFVNKIIYIDYFNSMLRANEGVFPFIINWLFFIFLVFISCCLIDYIRNLLFKVCDNIKDRLNINKKIKNLNIVKFIKRLILKI